jgi:hypothetical protein
MDKRAEAEFARADQAVDKAAAAAAIVAGINKLLNRRVDRVSHDYMLERLLLTLLRDHDLLAIIDRIKLPGPKTLALSNALADYRDSQFEERWGLGSRKLLDGPTAS